MTHFARPMWAIASTITLVLAMSIAAEAQRDEGRRGGAKGRGFGGGFGVPSVRLASIEAVQEALKLSEEQKDKIAEINDQMREDFRKILHEGGPREAMQKLNQDATAKLAELLDDEQQKRLRGISIQVLGARAALVDSAVAKELNITDEQKSKLADAQESHMRAMRDAFREMRDLPGDERWAKAQKLRDDADKKLLAVLTSEQQAQLESLKGEKVEIDMSQFRGPGGRGRLGDRSTK